MSEKQIHEIQFPDFVRHNINSWIEQLGKIAAQAGADLIKAAAVQATGRMLANQPDIPYSDFDELYGRIVQVANIED